MKLVVSAALAAVLLSGCAAKNAAESVVGGVGSAVGGVAGGAVGAAGAVVGGVGNAVGGVVDAVVDPSDADAPEMAAAESDVMADDDAMAEGDAMADDDAMSMGSPAEEPMVEAPAAEEPMVEAPAAEEPVAEETPVTLEEFCAANDFALQYIPDSDGGDDHKFCLDDGGVMVLEDNLQQYIASRAAQG